MGMIDYKPEEFEKMDTADKLLLTAASVISLVIGLGFLAAEVVVLLFMALIAIQNSFALAVGGVVAYGLVYIICGAISTKIRNTIRDRGADNCKSLRFVYTLYKAFFNIVLLTIAIYIALLAWPLNSGATGFLVILYLAVFGVGMFVNWMAVKFLDGIIDSSRKNRAKSE